MRLYNVGPASEVFEQEAELYKLAATNPMSAGADLRTDVYVIGTTNHIVPI